MSSIPINQGSRADGTPLGGVENRETLWTAKDVAAYLRASVSWVYQKAESGLLPCLPRLPGSNFLRFERDAIISYARGEWRADSVTTMRPIRSRNAR